jgi:hypothetical protein
MIIFSEKDHKYTHLESGNILKGWTSLIKHYTSPFDSDNQVICSAYSNYLGSKYRGIKFGRMANASVKELAEYLLANYPEMPKHYVDEVRYEWDYAAILGSETHLEAENASYARGYEINPFTDEEFPVIKMDKQYDNQLLMDDLSNLPNGYYPELLVYDFSMGQLHTPVTMIDKAFLKDGDAWIDDIKTNSSIWAGKDKKMSGVFSEIFDNTEEKYKLQACFGGKLLSTFGFKVRGCGFTHVKDYNLQKTKMYLAKYDEALMDKFQEDWKRIYDKLEIVNETD